MKKITIALMLLIPTLALAKTNPNPAEYTINVHVSSSSIGDYSGIQILTVIINGKKYELRGYRGTKFVLDLGDYKAKLVHEDHHGTYESYRLYEFLLSDQHTEPFMVVGQTE